MGLKASESSNSLVSARLAKDAGVSDGWTTPGQLQPKQMMRAQGRADVAAARNASSKGAQATKPMKFNGNLSCLSTTVATKERKGSGV